MELREFKKWIIENDFENNELFQEALICYCNRANRAAYLLSYLGFMEYLRDCIINYRDIPIKFKEKLDRKGENIDVSKEWNDLLEKLRDEDQWENAVKNIIFEAKYNIFCYDTKVREEFVEKKNIRNVCAHNKERPISNATIEDLWDFLAYVKPLSVINGSTKYLLKCVDEILQYGNRDEYKQKANEIFEFYKSLYGTEKENVLQQICKKIILYSPADNNYFFIQLFGLIFNDIYADEYQWITKIPEIECFAKLNVENYKHEINKTSFFKWIEKEDTEWERFSNCAPTSIIKYGKNELLKKDFLLQIYNNENHYTYWSNMLMACDEWEKFIEDTEILQILSKNENVKSLFQEVNKLYTYDNGYDKNKKTNTFDYSKFVADDKIARKVMLLLMLAKKGKIDITNEDMKDLLERCKLIIQYANNNNYEYMCNYLKSNENIYSWINSINI